MSFAKQFRSVFSRVIRKTVTVDFASAAASAAAGANVTVEGALPGDFVLVTPAALTTPAPSGGFTGVVNAANQVRVVYHNDAAGVVDLPSQTLKIIVLGE